MTPNVYQALKQEFKPDTTAHYLDKLSKFLNTLQSTGESSCAVWWVCVWPALQVEQALACLLPHHAQGGALGACCPLWSHTWLPAHQK